MPEMPNIGKINILIIAHIFILVVTFLFRSGLLLIASAQGVGPVVKTIVHRYNKMVDNKNFVYYILPSSTLNNLLGI